MINALTRSLEEMNGFQKLRKLLSEEKPGMIRVEGSIDSQKANLISALIQEEYSALIICENDLTAKRMYEDFRLYDDGAFLYPARDMVFYKAALGADPVSRERMKVIKALNEQKKATVITSTGGCLDFLLPFEALKNNIIELKVGEEADMEKLIKSLSFVGYERCSQIETWGQFSVRGGIVDIYDITAQNPYRIEFWGDEIDSIRCFELESQRSTKEIEKISIYPANEEIGEEEKDFCKRLTSSFIEYFQEKTLYFIDDPARVSENAKALYAEFYNAVNGRIEAGVMKSEEAVRLMDAEAMYRKLKLKRTVVLRSLNGDGEIPLHYLGGANLTVRSAMAYNNQYSLLVRDLKSYKKAKYKVVLVCASRTRGRRLANDLADEGLNAFYAESKQRELAPSELMVLYGSALKGFEYPVEKFILITESEMFGQKTKIKKREKRYDGKSIEGFAQLSIGDYVVHEFHGLGIYRGIEKIVRDGTSKDYLKIEYAKGDILYIQASQIGMLQKYGSSKSHSSLRLHSLSDNEWKRTKNKVRRAVRDIAADLIKLYAQRQNAKGYVYGPDTVWQREFEEMFPYEETQDQLEALEEIKRDMEKSGIMDRILVGDVGYGKTEVAVRAAFKAVQESKQVAVLVPTTILAQQHYLTFSKRMSDFPVKIEMLCRFRTLAQQKKTISDLKKGLADIVIGTHRILSKDVEFKDLGLLIVDEEQRFGVTSKEKIKQLKLTVDVLTLSATPIPRTLHMGLVGIRDMSVLEDAPKNRLPIQTYVMEYDAEIVREAISREVARGGQVYFVYNRVAGIAEMAYRITQLVPNANVAYAHGQMKERELERVMYSFINQEIDVLVSTTIIETGMDISNVNTIIVYDADMFGLAQLYQLRGRIGRSDRRAYAFFMYRPNKILKEEAEKRLSSIREFTDLGSGIKIAMRDLQIRGAGNLLGEKQSGHIDDVGYDLYCKLLKEAVDEAKGESRDKDLFETVVDINVSAYIPDKYIQNEAQRLEIYKKIGSIENKDDKSEIIEELIDRFGTPDKNTQNLLEISMLKAQAHNLYITEVKQLSGEIKFSFYKNAKIKTEGIPELIIKYGGSLKLYTKEIPYLIYKLPRSNKTKINLTEELNKLLADFSEHLL